MSVAKNVFATEQLVAPTQPEKAAHYNVAIGYLRAFVTVLVVAHHAVLAYFQYAPPPMPFTAEPRLWRAFPVVDSARWPGFTLFVGFNDIFFMSLMFFLSGLFVWNSLQRKGAGSFLRDRVLRLGLPFAVAAALLAPIAYYPAYLTATHSPSVAGYLRAWFSFRDWPAGPAWFIWLLLAFDGVAAGLYALSPKWGESIGRLTSRASRRPVAFFALLVGVSAAVYISMSLAFTSYAWAALGPFTFQTSRLFHYAAYFLAGVGVGAWGIERGLLAPDGKLARRWWLWLIAALPAYAVVVAIVIAAAVQPSRMTLWTTVGGFAFAVSCATSGFAFLALFVRFAKKTRRVFDSLRDNAYGIYIVHYAFVAWVQYALLPASMSGLVKGSVAFLGALALSWGFVAAIRRIPAVARVI
ncbi:MAG TPA: acyltransferase [Bryobacteraceae bacterium]|nr:acyltransferase [Bryobacteraceae bacterium]